MPHCFEMCLAATFGKYKNCCTSSKKSVCSELSVHSTVKVIANISLTISMLAIVLYISSALDSIATFILPLSTIVHLTLISLLIIGAYKQKRS